MTQNNSDPDLNGMSMASNNIVKSWMKKNNLRLLLLNNKFTRFTDNLQNMYTFYVCLYGLVSSDSFFVIITRFFFFNSLI